MRYNGSMSSSASETKTVSEASYKLVDKHVGLDPEEQVLLLVRKHWIVFRNSVLLALFIPFVLLFWVYFINQWPLNWDPQIIHYLTMGLLIASAVCFVLGGIVSLWRWYNWHHTFYVMTNRRLVVMSQQNPWTYDIQQITLSKIIDVTLTQRGLESAIYGFSDVVSTTQSGSRFSFDSVGHPGQVQKVIMQQLAMQPASPPSPGGPATPPSGA